jgi:phosphatidate cytidylyltransferase
VLIAFKVGPPAALGLVTAVVTLAAAEAYAAFRQEGYHPVTLLGLVATVSVMVATYNKGEAALPLVIILLFAFSLVWYLAGVERNDAVRGTATTMFVFCWVGAFGSYAALLLSPNLFPDRHGIAFMWGAIIAAVAYDVGALAIGAWIGRHPLAPSVSPNKTWEGFFGGALTCIVVTVVVVHLIHPWTVGKAAALGLTVSIVSPVGDLCESLVKRQLGRKDMGRLLPGHGGLLDRVDGLLFVLPATFYLVKALHLG